MTACGRRRKGLEAFAELTDPGSGAVRTALAQEDLGGVRGGEALEHFLVGLALARHGGGLELLGAGGGNHGRIDVEAEGRDGGGGGPTAAAPSPA